MLFYMYFCNLYFMIIVPSLPSPPSCQVMDHLTLIKDRKHSRVTQYLRKMLAKKGVSVDGDASEGTPREKTSSTAKVCGSLATVYNSEWAGGCRRLRNIFVAPSSEEFRAWKET